MQFCTEGSHRFYRKYDWTIWLTLPLLLVLAPICAQSQPIVINEIMFHPPMARDDLQFVELLNIKDEVIELAGWRLTAGLISLFQMEHKSNRKPLKSSRQSHYPSPNTINLKLWAPLKKGSHIQANALL